MNVLRPLAEYALQDHTQYLIMEHNGIIVLKKMPHHISDKLLKYIPEGRSYIGRPKKR